MNIFNLECPNCNEGAIPLSLIETGEKNCYFLEVKKCVCCEHLPDPNQVRFLFATMVGSYNAFKTAQHEQIDKTINDKVKSNLAPESKIDKKE